MEVRDEESRPMVGGAYLGLAECPCEALPRQPATRFMQVIAQRSTRPRATIRALVDDKSGMYYLEARSAKVAGEVFTRTEAIYSSADNALRCADAIADRLRSIFDLDLVCKTSY